MTLDVVNSENKKVGSVDLDDAGVQRPDQDRPGVGVGGPPERVGAPGHAQGEEPRARERRRQEAVRQKGTGRPQVGSSRTPLWRHGGTVFPPQPRSYDYRVPKKVERGALKAAFMSKLKDGVIVVGRRAQGRGQEDEGRGRAARAPGRDEPHAGRRRRAGRELPVLGAEHRRASGWCRADGSRRAT
jgi:hypothetical protein